MNFEALNPIRSNVERDTDQDFVSASEKVLERNRELFKDLKPFYDILSKMIIVGGGISIYNLFVKGFGINVPDFINLDQSTNDSLRTLGLLMMTFPYVSRRLTEYTKGAEDPSSTNIDPETDPLYKISESMALKIDEVKDTFKKHN